MSMKNARGEHLCPMTSNTAAEKEQLLHICRVQLTSGLPTYVFFKLWSADNDTADAVEIWFEEEVRIMTQTCCPKHVFFFFYCFVPLQPKLWWIFIKANGQVLTSTLAKCSSWVGSSHGNPQQTLCLSLPASDRKIIDPYLTTCS